jgi:purine-binding chemotaxis protein CheW
MFGVTVDSVHEILDPQTPTAVPNADPFAPGLINVRGVVVPVVDVRRRLGIGPAEVTETTRMIVLEYASGDSLTKLAFSADAVEEVIEADLGALERMPELGSRWQQIYLRGALRRNGDLVVILETETLFAQTTEDKVA